MSEEEPEKKPELIARISKYIPSITKPEYKQTLNSRLKWTGIALLCYFLLSYITVSGLESGAYTQFHYFQMVLGAKFGSLVTLGIGPIVTSGIILQLLVGAKLIKWDTTKPEGRRKFQSWSKFLAVAFCFIEAAAFVLAGTLPVSAAGGMSLKLFVILQVAAGGMIVILLDDLISKWGFGSGVSLFIAAGVASQIFIGLFSPLILQGNIVGAVPGVISSAIAGNSYSALTYLVPILTTALVFFVVMYVQGIHIDIPLTFSSIRGFGRTWSLKFLYASVIPVIFISALLANVQVFGRMGAQQTEDGLCGIMGCFDENGNPKSGAAFYLTSPRNLINYVLPKDPAVTNTNTTENSTENATAATSQATAPIGRELIRAGTYLAFLCIGAMIFSLFWVNTSGMDAKSVAGQLDGMGMQIPGYRRDPRIMESVLNRYIPALTILGGLAIGVLAATADFLGAIGSGTGILLTIMIFNDFYERLKHEKTDEAHPIVRKIIGE